MNNKYALVIDDSELMRQMVCQTLRQGAHIDNILEANDPDHALRLLEGFEGELQFIVSDWNMPGTPLPDFMSILEEEPRFSMAPVFVVTASEQKKIDEIISSVHPTALLTKPFEPDKLLDLLETYVGLEERRRSKRVQPIKRCEVDIGFEVGQQTYAAEVADISDTGILLSCAVNTQGVSHVYDFVDLKLLPLDSEEINLQGQIVRIEAGSFGTTEFGSMIKIAVNFCEVDAATRAQLSRYIMMNDVNKIAEGTH